MIIIKRTLLIIILLVLLSLIALWSWGRFANSAQGKPSIALSSASDMTYLDRLIQTVLNQRPKGESGATLIYDSQEAFLARAQSARLAERSLDLQYYIWNKDLTGNLLIIELHKAAERGVRVRLLLDDMNAVGKDATFLLLDQHPNIEIRLFNPARNRAKGFRRAIEMGFRFIGFNRRMHNKAWIADNRLAMVGGRNIGDEYFGAADTNFHDMDLLLLGPVVEQASDIFDDFWNSPTVIPLQALQKKIKEKAPVTELTKKWLVEAQGSPWLQSLEKEVNWLAHQLNQNHLPFYWSDSYRILSDPPEKASALPRERDNATWLLYDIMALLYSAEEENWIMSPYFVPGEAAKLMLSGQSRRGVDVRILTNSLAATDVPLVHAGYIRYRKQLLQQNVDLYELRPGERDPELSLVGSSGASLHSKSIVIDGKRGFVGSFNFDPRSAQLNTEMGVMFHQPELAHKLKAVFKKSTEPKIAWQVSLNENGVLQWYGHSNKAEDRANKDNIKGDETKVERLTKGEFSLKEPKTSWGIRMLVRILRLLPLESQL